MFDGAPCRFCGAEFAARCIVCGVRRCARCFADGRQCHELVRLRTRDGRTHYTRNGRALCGAYLGSPHHTTQDRPASCRRCRSLTPDARQLDLGALPTDEDFGRAARFWTDPTADLI
jgi:hypothetical protein